MSKQSVFCITTSRKQADRIVDHLKNESFSNNHISVLFPDQGATGDLGPRKNTQAQKDPVTGVIIGTGLDWIAGIGPLAITGVGPFIAAGPIGVVMNGAAGGITHALASLGLSEIEAGQYEGKVKEANVLLAVHTDDVGDIARARAIFEQAGAELICTTGSARKDNQSTTANRTSPLAEPALSDN